MSSESQFPYPIQNNTIPEETIKIQQNKLVIKNKPSTSSGRTGQDPLSLKLRGKFNGLRCNLAQKTRTVCKQACSTSYQELE